MRKLPALSLLSLALASTAWAQEVTVPAVVPYTDRVIDASELPVLPPDEDAIDVSTSGMPRGLGVELSWGQTQEGEKRYEEVGLSLSGFLATPRWGDFSFGGTLSKDTDSDELRNSITVWQRNLRFGQDISVDNGVGVTNTPAPELMRNQYRFFLPTVTMQGVQTQLTHKDRYQVQAAVGRPGVFQGTRLAGFESREGLVVAAGGSAQLDDRWSVAASAMDARVEPEPDDRLSQDFINHHTKTLYAAAAWKGARDRYQLNVLGSRADGSTAQGLWLDGDSARGRYTHRYGAFYLQPDLAWGLSPINNDLKGAYYRLGYQYGRWDWNTGLDAVRSISGEGLDGYFGTGYLRYQVSRTLGLGSSGSVRQGDGGTAASVQVFADKRNFLGQGRVQVDAANDGGGVRDTQISFDQSFLLTGSNRLAVNVAFGQTQGASEYAGRRTTLAVYGGRDLTDTLSLDGNLRYSTTTGGSAEHGADANVGLSWRPSAQWNVTASYYRSQGTQRTPFILDPLVPVPDRVDLPRSQSVYVAIRYDWNAGRPSFVVGGAPGSATGSISGTLFLDENINGVRDANEEAAANITVTIDDRFSVRTDSNGRYDFPLVSVGKHRLTIVADNLPLPWSFEQGDKSVQVSTRDITVLDVGATRPR